MQARAIFELEEPTVEGDAILMSLSVSLSKYCPGFSRISVQRSCQISRAADPVSYGDRHRRYGSSC
jgi:hypothetical protein